MGHTRGRRKEKKDKKAENDQLDTSADFISLDGQASDVPEPDFTRNGDSEANHDDNRDNEASIHNQASFFGLLDRQELEYFKAAESTLAANALLAEEKGSFVANVFDEAKGKELKLVTNQVCSKLMERLIDMSDSQQICSILAAFTPQALPLSIQKFASHCLEASLIKANDMGQTQAIVDIAREIEPHFNMMVTEKYASHVLRTLITIISGLPYSATARSRKSATARKHTDLDTDSTPAALTETSGAGVDVDDLPQLYQITGKSLVETIEESWEITTARRYAIDPISSPVLQLLIKADSKLLGRHGYVSEVISDENFIEHCISDPVGSHFLQTAIGVLPSKAIEKLYKAKFAGRLDKIACQSIGNYVVQAFLTHSKSIKSDILSELDSDSVLTNLVTEKKWGVLNDLALIAPPKLLAKLYQRLAINVAMLHNLESIQELQLLETLGKDDKFAASLWQAAADLSEEQLAEMGLHPLKSRLLELILRSFAQAQLASRRKLLNSLVPLAVKFAVNANGSHVVDALWYGVSGLKFIRERIATVLVEHEEHVKGSIYGRLVWKNWSLFKYMYKRHEWWNAVKEQETASGLNGVAKTPVKVLKNQRFSSFKNGSESKRRKTNPT